MDERQLLESWRPWLRVTAANMTYPDKAEDLAQEGWIALWRAIPTYDGRTPFEPWCKAVMRNRMMNVIRDSHAQLRDIRREHRVGNVADVCDVGEEVEGVELAYHHGEIYRAIDRLTDHQRAYVVARFWGELSFNELNERFNTKNSNALWRSRIQPKLAMQLAHLGEK